MDHCQIRHGSFEAILILDPVDVKEAYGHSASRYHSLKWHVWSYGWRYVSFSKEEDSVEWRLTLCREVSVTVAGQILCKSNSNDGYDSHFSTYTGLVLATGLGKLPAVLVWTGKMVWFGFQPVHRPDPIFPGRVVTLTRHRTLSFWWGWNRTAVPTSRFLQLWVQFSIWVLIELWDDEYADCVVLQALSPPALRFGIQMIFVEWLWNKGKYYAKFTGFRWRLHECRFDQQSDSGMWKCGWHCTIYVLIMSRYDQNWNTQLQTKLWGWNAGFLLVKPTQLEWSGLSWDRTRCNGSVSVPTLTWTHPSELEPLLTLHLILFGSCDRFGSGKREWILILSTRLCILRNTKMHFWGMWRLNTLPNIDVCRSLHPTAYRATFSSPPQQYQDLVNLPLIHMVCGAMINNTNEWQCGWNDTRTEQSRSTHIDYHQALFEFTAWITKELGASQSKSQCLLLRPNGDQQDCLDNGYHRLVATMRRYAFTVRQCHYWGTRHILYLTTWHRSGGQFFPCARWHRLQAARNHRRDPCWTSRCKVVSWSQSWDIASRWPSIGYNEHRKLLRNEERGRGKNIAQNGQGPWLIGDVAGQPNPTCYTEAI